MRSSVICSCVSALLFLSAAACSRSPKAYLDTGNRLFEEGKYPDAQLNYQKALQRDAKFAEAYYRLGLVLLKQNKPREALDSFSQAVQLAPGNQGAVEKLADLLLVSYLQDRRRPEFLYNRLTKLSAQLFQLDPRSFQGFRIQGFLSMTNNKPAEAAASFRKALEVRPDDPDVTLALMKPLIDQQQPGEAERVAKAAIEKHKDFAQLYDMLYVLYLSEKREGDAEKIFQTKIANNPKNTDYALQLCSHYYQHKKYPELNAAIQRILADSTNYPDGPLKVGEFYAQRHDWKEAAAQVELGIRTRPEQKAVYQKLQLDTLLAQNKQDEALALAETMLKSDPLNTAALAVRGTLFMNGKLDAAQKDFQVLVDKNPTEPVFLFKLGRVYQMKGDLVNAKMQYEASAKLRTGYLPPRLGLAEISFDQHDYKGSVDHLNSVLRHDATNPQTRLMLVASLMGLGSFDKARAEMTALLKDFPKYPAAEVQLAYLNMSQKRYKDADLQFRKFYRAGAVNNPRVVLGLVENNLAQGNGDAALDLIRNEMKYSKSPALPAMLADAAARSGKYDVAIEQFKQLVATQPDSSEFHAKLGESYRMAGDSVNAIAELQKAATLAPKLPGPTVSLAYMLASAGRVQEAKAQYEKALTIQPDNVAILNNLAMLLAETGGDLPEGMKHAQRALAKDPENPDIRDTMGWLYSKMNNPDAAAKILDNLTQKYPTNPAYRYHLGYVLLQKGNKQGARSQLETALSNKPAKDQEAAIRKLLASIGS